MAKIPPKDGARIEAFVFAELDQYQSIEQIGNVEKLQGHDTFYQLRFGNY